MELKLYFTMIFLNPLPPLRIIMNFPTNLSPNKTMNSPLIDMYLPNPYNAKDFAAKYSI